MPPAGRSTLFCLVIDLAAAAVTKVRGFSAGIDFDQPSRQTWFATSVHAGRYQVFAAGRAFGTGSGADVAVWLEDFTPTASWATRIDGDWVVVALDREQHSVTIVSDRNGCQRAYYAEHDGRIVVGQFLLDVLDHLPGARVSGFSAYCALTTYYCLDPYSPCEGVWVTTPGQIVTLAPTQRSVDSYHEVVPDAPSFYRNEEECVQGLDGAMRRVFAKRASHQVDSLVLLSGGIDSVAMLRYLSDASPRPVHTLTFSVAGQCEDEHEPARVAADFFRSTHHRVILDPGEFIRGYIEAVRNGWYPCVSTLLAEGVRRHIGAAGQAFDIYSGEDHRLHTPTFEHSTRLGVYLNGFSDGARYPRLQAFAARLLRAWPLYPRNFLAHVATLVQPYPSRDAFMMRCLNRFDDPLNPESCDTAAASRRGLSVELVGDRVASTFQELFHWTARNAYRLQHTDNMEQTRSYGPAGMSVQSPFFDWEIVSAASRIPFAIGSRTMLTLRSWSRVPLVNKRVLRRALAGHVPPSLLYRAKATRGAEDAIFGSPFRPFLASVLERWADAAFHDALPGDAAALCRAYVARFLAGALDQRTVYNVLAVAYLAMVHAIGQGTPREVLIGELEALAARTCRLPPSHG